MRQDDVGNLRVGGESSVAPLMGAQFIAVAWIAVNQFRDHLGLAAGAHSGLVAKGYIGAALFFVLSGFLLCRRYQQLRLEGRFDYVALLWRRLTFTYPLHLGVLLVILGGLVAGGALGGPARHASFGFGDLPANLLFMQAWGLVRTDTWNFPSWLVSAEWFAWLVFPLTAWVALKGLRWTALALALPIGLFILLFVVADQAGILFTDMTTRVGALQTVPAFLLGAALWRLSREHSLSSLAGALLAATALGWIIVAALLRLSDLFIWPAFAPLTFGLAQFDKAQWGEGAMTYLGRLSIAIMLVYLPVDIAYFRAARWLFGSLHGAQAWLLLSGVFPTIFLGAVAAYHGFQRPVWRWLQTHGPGADRPSLPTDAV